MFDREVKSFDVSTHGVVNVFFKNGEMESIWFWNEKYTSVLDWCIGVLLGNQPLNAPPTLPPTVEELPLMHPYTGEVIS